MYCSACWKCNHRCARRYESEQAAFDKQPFRCGKRKLNVDMQRVCARAPNHLAPTARVHVLAVSHPRAHKASNSCSSYLTVNRCPTRLRFGSHVCALWRGGKDEARCSQVRHASPNVAVCTLCGWCAAFWNCSRCDVANVYLLPAGLHYRPQTSRLFMGPR